MFFKSISSTSFVLICFINAITCQDTNHIRNLLENGKKLNLTRVSKELKDEVNKYIKDPYPIRDFKINLDNTLATLNGDFTNIQLSGLNQLTLRKVKLNLIKIKLRAKLDIKKLKLTGNYSLDGKITFFPLKGNGKFTMNITGIEIDAMTVLSKTPEGHLHVTTIALDLETSSINVHFDNLMEGRWSSIYNTVINTLSNLIFDEIKYFLLSDIEEEIRARINNELKKLPSDIFDSKSQTIFDDVLEKSKQAMKPKFEPFILQNQTKQFDFKLLVNLHGELSLYDGNLNGLSTLKRTGDVIAVYEDNALILEVNLGFDKLNASYKWYSELFTSKAKGSVRLNVETISAMIRIRQPLEENALATLDDFEIKDIGYIWVDVRGIGTADYVIEIFVNLITNIFKGSLAKTITGPMKLFLQEEVQKYGKRFI